VDRVRRCEVDASERRRERCEGGHWGVCVGYYLLVVITYYLLVVVILLLYC
jgi:hypothetical protein